MPKFSARSLQRLRTCDARLERLFLQVVDHYDCTILEGYRGQEAQDAAFERGASKVRWPDGRHNRWPSKAADVAPYPIDWGGPLVQDGNLNRANLNARLRFYHFAGFVRGAAEHLGTPVRWGGDWDGDRDLLDQDFYDLVHFELINP